MSTTDIVFQGMYHAAGDQVSVFVAGLDCGDFTVDANGTVTVPLASDPDGLLGPTYLATIAAQGGLNGVNWGDLNTAVTMANGVGGTATYYVPVVIGYAITSQGQCLRPTIENDIKSPTGPGLGKVRRGHQYSTLLRQSGPMSFGTSFTTLMPAQFRYANQKAYPASTPFSGVHWDTLEDDYSFDGMLCWQQNRPYPTAVVSVGFFLQSQDR